MTIAGSDSGGGAGIQADIKTITMLGGFAMTAITAVTAQNTLGVTMVEALSPAMVAAQIDACVSDIGVDAVKIGAQAFLEKPITLQKLLKAVEQGLAKEPLNLAVQGQAAVHQAPSMLSMASVAIEASQAPEVAQSFELDRPLREARDAFEKAYFEFHLTQEGGSMTKVAEKTGLERTHLYRKLKQLGVDLSRSKRMG